MRNLLLHEPTDETQDGWGICRYCSASEKVAWSDGDECPERLIEALEEAPIIARNKALLDVATLLNEMIDEYDDLDWQEALDEARSRVLAMK